jgi:UDP-GlcNAc3NAcA epimerase
MKKIVTVVGARPQFIKAAVISRTLKEESSDSVKEIIVHTGQHYDKNMSDVFFHEMEIPQPDYNLNVGSGTHGKMTGRMLEGIETLLLDEKPDMLLVYGDTNSTIAGALAASKLHIPVAHIEAGLRSFNMKMPEEQNRILTDHISSQLFCPTDTAVENLKNEGISEGVFRTGDVMLDASLFYRKKNKASIQINTDKFILMTLHRAENTDDPQRLKSIISAINQLDGYDIILPLHPRTKKIIAQSGEKIASHIRVIEPVGFFDMLYLEERCQFILTDSGGVQKEAFFFKKPCITLRDQTEWVETIDTGWNVLVGAEKNKIINAVESVSIPRDWPDLYGDGNSGRVISKELINHIC